jgi:hypothetical protein
MEIQIAQIIYFALYLFYYLIELIKNWWWFLAPFLIWHFFVVVYLYWIQNKWDSLNVSKIVLEIRLPPDVLKPLKAMEQTLNCFWGPLYDPPNWKEKWFLGKYDLRLSLEIVSDNGVPHFYMVMDRSFKQSITGCIYGQFPDAEITEVDDYTKEVPLTAPNNDWDLFGADLVFTSKKDFFPIRTLSKFFEGGGENVKEEKRLDPIASLLEAMATQTRDGEHIWVQLNFHAVTDVESKFFTNAKEFIDKLAKRPAKPKSRTVQKKVYEGFVFGKKLEDELPEKKSVMPEMELTPGEKDILRSVEDKMSKPIFKSCFRIMYVAKKDVFFKPQIRIPFSFTSQFAIFNMNAFLPFKPTFTKIVYFMKNRRVFARKRALLRRYRKRQWPLVPYPGGTIFLNSEEIASVFHFPSKSVSPGPYIPRVQAKKVEVPPEVPIG